MEVFGYGFPNVLIKFCEKEEYAKDIADGNVYMKESGYYRKVDDKFRGDIFDGRCPIDVTGKTVTLGDIVLPMVSNAHMGFEHDDKIPMFCATLLTEEILERLDDKTFCFRPEFVQDMMQFGKYFVWVNLDEFFVKMKGFVETNGFGAKCGRVEYVRIMSEYEEVYINNPERDLLAPFFKKDKQYQQQNEWRMILMSNSNSNLINTFEDHYVMRLGKLESASVQKTDLLKNSNIELKETENP